jgi:hypothetical protein
MENKHDPNFDRAIAACQAKHLRDILAFKRDWNNEVIAQFCDTVCFEEHEDTRKLHWMTESQWYEISYGHYARLFGFGQKDASRCHTLVLKEVNRSFHTCAQGIQITRMTNSNDKIAQYYYYNITRVYLLQNNHWV